MKKLFICLFVALVAATSVAKSKKAAPDLFPDGTPIPTWFSDAQGVSIENLGKTYKVTDYGVLNDGRLHTAEFQALIDEVAQKGGGVIVVPQGIFHTGPLYFKQGTHLYLMEGATLMGSDDISDFPVMSTRIEGESCSYFGALINVDGLDGFSISGKGTIDGNGMRYWKAFWLRRKWNPKCTNKDEMRPRLLYVSNSKNVTIQDVHLQNSPFWTSHFYRCSYVKVLGVTITSPAKPVKAPSTDAIDIDVCENMLVKNCYMSVNDDAVALKGGKGPWADQDANNGSNKNIIIEDCEYGFCHGCLTCGSESLHNRNIVLRRIKVGEATRLLWLKMRPDTPQRYEYITVEDISGNVSNFLYVKPWTQFYDLKGRPDTPISYSNNITMRNITLDCKEVFAVERNDSQYRLSDFTFENLNLTAQKPEIHEDYVDGLVMKNVNVVKKEK